MNLSVMISMISTVHKRSRLIVIRGFKINLDLRTYSNSNQLLQAKLKLLHYLTGSCTATSSK